MVIVNTVGLSHPSYDVTILGDKVSKSSSPDPRKIVFLVCHVTM